MRFVLIDNGEPTQRRMEHLTKKYGLHIKMPVESIEPSKIRPDDVVILTGGGTVEVKDDNGFYADEVKLIKTHPGTIIGVCLGMQLIARTFGAPIVKRYRRLDERLITIFPERNSSIITKPVKVWQKHRYAVRTAPEGFDVLARSNSDIEIIKHRTKPIWGMQFHPECSGVVGEKVFEEILKR